MRLRRNAAINERRDSELSVPSVALDFMPSVASAIMKDYRHRVNQVVAHRVDLLSIGAPLLLLRAPPGAHQDRFRADRVPEIDVEPLVADDPRLLRIDAEIADRIIHHAGQRLSTAAIDAELLHRP